MNYLYVKAQNIGAGFITHEDRELFDITGYFGFMWVIENNEHSIQWIDRVQGIEISKEDAQKIINILTEELVDPITNTPISAITLP
jgi:hypothetical protein